MRGALRFVGWILGLALVLGAVARLTLLEPWTIPEDPYLAASIAPTLAGGDTVLLLTAGTPGFGDLVRCPDPEEAGRWVIGRIAGLPGDAVRVDGVLLSVNGRSYASSEACKHARFTVTHPDTGDAIDMQCDRVEMGAGWHFRGSRRDLPPRREEVELQVEEGQLFLLSDNRDLHEDSRDFGTVPRASCKERVVFRLWGLSGYRDAERRFTVIR